MYFKTLVKSEYGWTTPLAFYQGIYWISFLGNFCRCFREQGGEWPKYQVNAILVYQGLIVTGNLLRRTIVVKDNQLDWATEQSTAIVDGLHPELVSLQHRSPISCKVSFIRD